MSVNRDPGALPPGYNSPNYQSPHHYLPHPGVGPSQCRDFYRVQPGDDLSKISYRFGIPTPNIVAANPGIDFNLPLAAGRAICLPEG